MEPNKDLAETDQQSVSDPFEPTDDSDDPEYIPEHDTDTTRTNIIKSQTMLSFLTNNSKRRRIMTQSPKDTPDPDNSTTSDTESSTSTTTVYTSTNKNMNPLFDRNFFRFVEQKDIKFIAQCIVCLPRKKLLQGVSNSNANFVKHLKKQHEVAFQDYLKHKEDVNVKKQDKKVVKSNDPFQTSNSTQLDIAQSFQRSKKIHSLTNELLILLLTQCWLYRLLSIHVLEEYFKE
ncbi:unnamed protein product [Psylliodes chrysocephalus]|uniref:BED-type domain-containing protein n=1 Tax=Psylliodes chrysocephalus TaxID=3402493 RepID=A0A9P0CK22_9CUCU|nr:unnamed protein product [Psylliodes chrysocephala]